MDINRIINKSANYKTIVEEYKIGKLIVKDNLEPILYSKNIDWNYIHQNNERTYQIYLHSLNIVKAFIQMYKNNNDHENLKIGKQIILDWYRENINLNDNNLAWNEHAVSYRVLNIIYFQENAGKNKLPNKIFKDIIDKHVKFLNDDKNYRENNHGIMMDNSLLIISNYLTDIAVKNLIIEKVYYRLTSCVYRDFSYKGLHLENSPEYHILVVNLLKKSKLILEDLGRPFSKNINEILVSAEQLNSIIIKPNKEFPLIGDTSLIRNSKMPKKFTDFVDYEAGVSVLHNRNENNYKKSTWFMFKTGYQRLTHKHQDDLSFSLYTHGKDIFIDSGKFSYDNSDTRKFLVSPHAHNTLLVENKNYNLKNPMKDQLKMSLSKVINKNQYKLVSGKNNLYHATYLSRTCVLTKNNSLIIFDSATSKIKQTYIQNFVLTPEARITELSESKFEIEVGEEQYILEYVSSDRGSIESTVSDSKVSYQFGKMELNQRVQFKKNTYKTNFLTVFYNKRDENILNDIHINRHSIIYWDDGNKVTINL